MNEDNIKEIAKKKRIQEYNRLYYLKNIQKFHLKSRNQVKKKKLTKVKKVKGDNIEDVSLSFSVGS